MLAQVADLERGQRIKTRRVEMHLTQPAVVDLIEDLAKQLPDSHALHPANLGKAPVTLRGLQSWEQGGGIAWEKAKLLAQALQTDVRSLINGTAENAPTPDLSRDAGSSSGLDDRLDRIERALADARTEREEHAADIRGLLERQDAVLQRVEQAIEREEQAKTESEEAKRSLLAAVDVASRALRAGAPRSAEAPEQPAR